MKIKYIILFLAANIVASCQSDNLGLSSSNQPFVNDILPVKEKLTDLNTPFYHYCWIDNYDHNTSLFNHVLPPKGYKRINLDKTSFGNWLRHLPLDSDNNVYLHNGEKKYNQAAQFRVLNIDIGSKDLQQCADAVMRLRAEYLYTSKQYDKIHFNYTNGINISFLKWSDGFYPSLKKNKVVWVSSSNNKSYKSFKKYLTNIFMYAGTASLEKEMKTIPLLEMMPGDVLIKGGFPGHAVTILDVAINEETSDKVFMIAQSYMPAQSLHVLKNPKNNISP